MNEQLYIYIIILAAGLILGGFTFNYFSRVFKRKAYVDRAEFARFSEEEAEEFLKKNGYKIIEKKKKATVMTNIDGKDHVGYVVCDYIVKKGRKIYVAEVKSGQVGVNPNEPSTRRQLLEYDYVYNPDGLLLVNMLDQQIHEVSFYFPKFTSDNLIIKLALGALAILFVVVIVWMMIQLRMF